MTSMSARTQSPIVFHLGLIIKTDNPYKIRVRFVGHMQTVQTQTKRRKMRCLTQNAVSHQGRHCLLTEYYIKILIKMEGNSTQQPTID